MKTGAYRWAPPIALAFVIAALVALVAVPWLGMHQMQTVQEELARVAAPSRELVTRMQLSLALQGAALLDFGETGDRVHLDRFAHARDDQRQSLDALRPLAMRLGPEVRARFDTLSARQTRWLSQVDTIEASGDMPTSERPQHLIVSQRAYEDVLIAAAELDQALSRIADARWRKVSVARRQESWLAAILGGTALAAALAVGWLGRRLHDVADEAERRRHEVERVMERKATFTRGLSHDLKNPLGAIDGHAELLESGVRGELTEPQRQSVRRIRGLVHALMALVDDVLEIARAEAGQLPIVHEPVDVTPVVEETVEAHRAAAVGAGLDLALDPLPRLPAVSTDAHRVRQVLGNLLSNAIKYTPTGGHVVVHAGIRRTQQAGANTCLVVDVCDTGPGIPEEAHELIFEEFSRLDPSGSDGAGVGLAIARQIARLLGGDITLDSEVGRGSTFTLWLPLPREAPARDATSWIARTAR